MDNKLKQTPLAATIAQGKLSESEPAPTEAVMREPREGSTLHYTILRLPHNVRHRVLRTLALTDTIASCLIGVREAPVVQTKLQWWSDEIGRLANNEARHPMTQSCADWLGADANTQTHLNTVLDAATAARFEALEEDLDWLSVVQRDYSARLYLLHTALSDAPAPNFDTFALSAAWVDILGTLPRRIHHDQIAFPPSLYERFSITREQLLKHIRVEGKPVPAATEDSAMAINQLLQAGISEGVSAADATLASDTHKTLRRDENTRALTIWLHLRRAQLRLWQQKEPNLLRETITITPLRKWFIAFRQR